MPRAKKLLPKWKRKIIDCGLGALLEPKPHAITTVLQKVEDEVIRIVGPVPKPKRGRRKREDSK